ncbi:MAG: SAM-dependent DNA methyltransferase, partial [Alphaproteobacteria bacterium]
MQAGLVELEKGLWGVADELRANSGLKASEYSSPVLGLIFLRFAEVKFDAAEKQITGTGSSRRSIGPAHFHAQGVLFVDDGARFARLVAMPEGADLGHAVNEAMRLIEEFN